MGFFYSELEGHTMTKLTLASPVAMGPPALEPNCWNAALCGGTAGRHVSHFNFTNWIPLAPCMVPTASMRLLRTVSFLPSLNLRCPVIPSLYEVLFFFLMATTIVYGSSWARDQIRAAAATSATAVAMPNTLTYHAGLRIEPTTLQRPKLLQSDS